MGDEYLKPHAAIACTPHFTFYIVTVLFVIVMFDQLADP